MPPVIMYMSRMFEEEEGGLGQIDLEFGSDFVVYNGRKVNYAQFLEETVLETFFLSVMDYGEDLLSINDKNGFQEIFNEAFTFSFAEISRQYEVPETVSDLFSGKLLDTRHLKNKNYIRYVTDVKQGVLNLLTTVSLN